MLKAEIKQMVESIPDEDAKMILKTGGTYRHWKGGVSLFNRLGDFSFGMAIRNNLNLWSPESHELRKEIWDDMSYEEQKFFNDHWMEQCGQVYQGKDMHADDASMVLIDRLYKAIKEKYSETGN